MTIPPIANFTLKEDSFWYAISQDKNYNLFVNDDGNVPDRQSYELLVKAEAEIAKPIERSDRYIKAFVDIDKAGIGSDYSVVEIGALKERGLVVLKVTINYDEDPYSLWATLFLWDKYNGWEPFSFSRIDW